jgi:hypothetical protein
MKMSAFVLQNQNKGTCLLPPGRKTAMKSRCDQDSGLHMMEYYSRTTAMV